MSDMGQMSAAQHRTAAQNELAGAEAYQEHSANTRPSTYDGVWHQNLLLSALVHAVLALGETEASQVEARFRRTQQNDIIRGGPPPRPTEGGWLPR